MDARMHAVHAHRVHARTHARTHAACTHARHAVVALKQRPVPQCTTATALDGCTHPRRVHTSTRLCARKQNARRGHARTPCDARSAHARTHAVCTHARTHASKQCARTHTRPVNARRGHARTHVACTHARTPCERTHGVTLRVHARTQCARTHTVCSESDRLSETLRQTVRQTDTHARRAHASTPCARIHATCTPCADTFTPLCKPQRS
jgi:hypothetical protein